MRRREQRRENRKRCREAARAGFSRTARRRARGTARVQKRQQLRPARADGTAGYARRRCGLWRDARARLLARRGKSEGCKAGKKELLRGILLDARTRARQTLRLCSYAEHPCPSRRVSSRPDGARMEGVYALKAARCRRSTISSDHAHRAPISMKGQRRKRQRWQQAAMAAATAAPGETSARRKPASGKPPTGQKRESGIPPDPRRAGSSGPAVRQSSDPAVLLRRATDWSISSRMRVCRNKLVILPTSACPSGRFAPDRHNRQIVYQACCKTETGNTGARGRISHTFDGKMTNVF